MKIDPSLSQIRLGATHSRKGFLRRLPLDLPLLGGLLLLSGIAMVVLYSASGQDLDALIRQGLRLLLALGVMLGVASPSRPSSR